MLLGVLLSLASCSYTFKRQDLNLGTAQQPAGTQRLFIPLVDNVTNRTGIESIVTNSLREKFSSQKNIEVVNSEDDGNFKLLVTLTEYSTRFGTDPRRGNPGSAQAGGIGDRQTMAGNIILKLKIRAKLVERVQLKPDIYRIAWIKEYEQEGSFEASNRYTDEEGVSSSPYINLSRELIMTKTLSASLGQTIIDQAVQNF